MCIFVWVNGLHPEVFLEWLVTVKACQMGDENYRHIYNLFHYFGAGRYASLYSWNVLQRRYETVSGDILECEEVTVGGGGGWREHNLGAYILV